MSPIFDDAHQQDAFDNDHGREFDYAVRFERTRRSSGGSKAKPKRSSRPSYARAGNAPTMHNGIHRRRRKKIRW